METKGMVDKTVRPEGYFWIRTKGNFVAIQYKVVTDAAKAAAAFSSPEKGDGKIDRTLVGVFQNMPKGEILELPKDDQFTERSLKVRVNASAKEAGRTLRWAKDGDGWLVRVETVKTVEANGTNGATESTPAEAPAEAGNRRR